MAGAEATSVRARLLLIDASSSIYRAFFAIPALRSAQGVPTNAVLGFATMLQKALREERPQYAVVAWDSRGPTRHAHRTNCRCCVCFYDGCCHHFFVSGLS